MLKYDYGSLPAGWQVANLGEVVTFLGEQRIPIKESDRATMQGPYPYYGASGVIDHVNDYIFDGEFILLGEDGANILTRSQPLAFKVSGKIWVNNHAHVILPNSDMQIDFLTACLESISYVKYNTGTAQPKLPQSTCRKIPVVAPPLPEQRKIAEILNTWDEAIALTEQLIEALERRKKGLMQRLLTGEVRFPRFVQSEEMEETKYGDIPADWEYIPIDEVANEVSEKNAADRDLTVLSCTKYDGLVDSLEYFGRQIFSDDTSGYKLGEHERDCEPAREFALERLLENPGSATISRRAARHC